MHTDCDLLLKLPHRCEDKQQHTGTQEEQRKEEKTRSFHTKQTQLWYFHNTPFYLFQPTAHAASDVFITAVHSFASLLDIHLRVGVEIGWKCSYWHLTAITFALKPSSESPWSLNERWAHPLCGDCVQLTECDRDTLNPELILKSWYYYFCLIW